MSQGGYGGGYGGGGGGWGGPPRGYGQPPGYGPPPQGVPPGWGPPPGQPPGWGQPQGSSEGPMRFVKDAVIGGVVGGFLSAVPVLSALNCCFCLLNMVGAGVGVGSYLRSHPNERITAGDAALCGLMSGAIAGLLSSLISFVLALAAAPFIATLTSGVYGSLPPNVARKMLEATAASGGTILVRLPLTMVLFAGFGALGAYLAMQMFFKDRLAER